MASVDFAAGVSLASILQARDLARGSIPARLYYSIYISTTDWHLDPVLHAILGLSE